MHDVQKEHEWLQNTQAELEAETEEMLQVSSRLNDNFVKAIRLMWRQLFVIWAVVIILFIGGSFVLREVLFIPLFSGGQTNSITKHSFTSEIAAARQAPAVSSQAANPACEKVLQIFQQVREAQLNKDINLLVAAYSPSFPDLEEKKARILKTWEHYDYLDLTFTVENLSQQTGDAMMAKVVWGLTLEDRQSQEKLDLIKKYTVYLVNESGKWLIKNLVEERAPKLAGRIEY